MTFDAQSLIVLALVAGAAGYLARVVWKACFRPVRGCGACGDCPSSKSSREPNVVTIGPTSDRQHA